MYIYIVYIYIVINTCFTMFLLLGDRFLLFYLKLKYRFYLPPSKIPRFIAGLDKFTSSKIKFSQVNSRKNRARKKNRGTESKSMPTSNRETTRNIHFCPLFPK